MHFTFRNLYRHTANREFDIFAVMPQNEFNSCQLFPACTWTASGLATFIGSYLGPSMEEKKWKLCSAPWNVPM